MEKSIAISLKQKAQETADAFSNRQGRINEKFTIQEIIPLSENTACVIYEKDFSKKRTAFFFYYVNFINPVWWCFCPTDSHILGLEAFGKHKLEVERFNYSKNFQEIKIDTQKDYTSMTIEEVRDVFK